MRSPWTRCTSAQRLQYLRIADVVEVDERPVAAPVSRTTIHPPDQSGLRDGRAHGAPAQDQRDPRTIPLVSAGAKTVGDGVLAVATDLNVVFCQLAPWQFEYEKNFGLKRTFRRTSFLVTRLLANLGVSGETPLLSRLSKPVKSNEPGRWLHGLYLDEPEEWDDPYRFFRW